MDFNHNLYLKFICFTGVPTFRNFLCKAVGFVWHFMLSNQYYNKATTFPFVVYLILSIITGIVKLSNNLGFILIISFRYASVVWQLTPIHICDRSYIEYDWLTVNKHKIIASRIPMWMYFVVMSRNKFSVEFWFLHYYWNSC